MKPLRLVPTHKTVFSVKYLTIVKKILIHKQINHLHGLTNKEGKII